jgi:uncharacterized protein
MLQPVGGTGCYWVRGYRGIYRVPPSAVSADGHLLAGYQEHLSGLDRAPAGQPHWYHMTVVITTRCNLACGYCFQNTEAAPLHPGGAPSRIPGASLGDDSTAAILEFCRRQMAEREAERLDLMLFGGEPTLQLDQCLRLLAGARRIGLASAAMISNGTRLGSDAATALEQEGLQSVQVTFDGDAPVHDSVRTTIGGRGTFFQILRNLEQGAARTTLRWALRVNLTGRSIGSADALVDRLAKQLDPQRFDIGFSLVIDSGPGSADTLAPSPALARRVGGLYVRALEAGFGVSLPALAKCAACGEFGGATGSVVNADGTLYSCWESAGKQGYEVGTIAAGYASAEVIRPRWVSCGYGATNGPDSAATGAYRDAVDATILDWLYAAGRLSRRPAPAGVPEPVSVPVPAAG